TADRRTGVRAPRAGGHASALGQGARRAGASSSAYVATVGDTGHPCPVRPRVARGLLHRPRMGHADMKKLERALAVCVTTLGEVHATDEAARRALRLVRALVLSAREEMWSLRSDYTHIAPIDNRTDSR